jgi:hypothetical protein
LIDPRQAQVQHDDVRQLSPEDSLNTLFAVDSHIDRETLQKQAQLVHLCRCVVALDQKDT